MAHHETAILALVAIVAIATISMQVDTQRTGFITTADDYQTASDLCSPPKQIDFSCFEECSDCGDPPEATCNSDPSCYDCGEPPMHMCEPDMDCYDCGTGPTNNCMDAYMECSMSCPMPDYEDCWMSPDPEDMDGCHERNQQRSEAAGRQCDSIMLGCEREHYACEQSVQEAQERHNEHCQIVAEGCMQEEAECELAAQQEQEEHNQQCQEQSDECQRQEEQCQTNFNRAMSTHNDHCTQRARDCTERCCGCNEGTTECGNTCCGDGETCEGGECVPGCPRTNANGDRLRKCGEGSGLACCIQRDADCEIVYGKGTCMGRDCRVKYVQVPSTNIRSAISADAENLANVTRGTPVYVKNSGERFTWHEVFTDRKCTQSAGFLYFTKLTNKQPTDVGEHPAYGGGIGLTPRLETGGAIRG